MRFSFHDNNKQNFSAGLRNILNLSPHILSYKFILYTQFYINKQVADDKHTAFN